MTEKKSYAERIASFLEKMGSVFPNPQAATELRRLHEVNQELLKTMRQLACLGNGDKYGNSDGNIIAQAAIAKAEGESK